MPYWILETPAARELSGTAFKVLFYMLKRFNGSNNGRIAFGSRSGCFAKAPTTGDLDDLPIGIRPRTQTDVLKEIERVGFIACTKTSSFHQKRLAREWRLTWLPVGHQPATKEFLKYVPTAKTGKKQKPGRHTALSRKIQSGIPPYGPPTREQDVLYRAAHRPISDAHRAADRPHLLTIPGAADALSKARALSEARAIAASGARSSALRLPSKVSSRQVSDE